MRPYILITLFFILSSILTYGQIQQVKRMTLKLSTDEPLLIPINEKGFIILKDNDESKKMNTEWLFTRYDTAFEKVWEISYSPPHPFTLTTYYRTNSHIYLLYTKNQYTQRDFIILKISTETGNLSTTKDRLLSPIELKKMELVNDHIFFAGEIEGNPVVVHYDIKEKKEHMLTSFSRHTDELLDMRTDSTLNLCVVLVRLHPIYHQAALGIRIYTQDGLLINQAIISSVKRNLTFGQISLSPKGIFVIGGYSHKAGLISSEGLFITKIESEQNNISYYPYSSLNHFFSYLSPKRVQRITKNIQNKNKKGKKIKMSFQANIQPPFIANNHLICIADFFYPKYTQTSDPRGGITGETFEGLKYTHAIICAFDFNGGLAWNNCLPIQDVTTFSHKDFVRALVKNDTACLLYNTDHILKIKILKGNDVIKDKYTEGIQTLSSHQTIGKEEILGETAAWYADYFLIWGTQHINTYKEGKTQQHSVFYINKLKFIK